MRIILSLLLSVFVPPYALAQNTPASLSQDVHPSLQAIIQSLHAQLQQTQDQVTLADAELFDAEQKIVALQAQLNENQKVTKQNTH